MLVRVTGTPVLAALLLAGLCGGCASSPAGASSRPKQDFLQSERMAQAIEAFEQKRIHAEFQAAEVDWRQGQRASCRETLDRLVARHPEFLPARLLLAEVLLTGGDAQRALAHVEHVMAHEPDDAAAQHTAGLVHEALGQQSLAIQHLRRAAELEPQNEIYGLSLQAASTTHVALHTAFDSEGNRPASDVPVGPTGEAGAAEDVQVDYTEVDHSTALDNDPSVLIERAGAALRSGADTAARELFDRALAAAPQDPQVGLSVVVVSLRYGRPQLAETYAQALLRSFPDLAALHRARAAALYRQGEYAKAQAAIGQALSLDKQDALSYFLLGLTRLKLGDPSDANRHFETARRLDPTLAVSP